MEKEILEESAEAARQETMTLWVSRNGRAYKEEDLARYDGCTHRRCKCGNITKKHYTKCESCRDADNRERYLALPFEEWDKKTPLCIYGTDQYFFDESDIEDYCEDNDCATKDLMLVICKPNKVWELDPVDIYNNLLSEDGEIPMELQGYFDELNKKIREYDQPLSWSQGKKRTNG